MAELTPLDEKLAEVLGLAQLAGQVAAARSRSQTLGEQVQRMTRGHKKA